MKRLAKIITSLFRTKPAFRLAVLYLCLLTLLVLVLPWLPLPFQPNELDLDQVFARPFNWTQYQPGRPFHWLGTDALGRDVLTNTLHGARTAFAISFPVMLLATAVGLLLGTIAAMFGNSMRISRGRLLMLLPAVTLFFYYGLYMPLQLVSLKAAGATFLLPVVLAFVLPSFLLFVVAPALNISHTFRQKARLPLDYLVLRLIEILTSIPKLILILVLASFAPPSLLVLSVLLVLTFWTGPARLARAEMLRIREMPYFEAAISMGASQSHLILRQALPNLLAPIAVSFVFGLAGLFMIESTLSFLNIGVSTDLVSWGRMVAGIRSNTAAWWLVAFPGAFLSLTVLALQICSYYLLRASQEKQ